MDRVGDHLLAGAALPAEQYRRIRSSYLGDLFVNLPHLVRSADEVGVIIFLFQFLLEMEILFAEAFALAGHGPLDAYALGDHRGDEREYRGSRGPVRIRREL